MTRLKIASVIHMLAVFAVILLPGGLFGAQEYSLADLYRLALERAERIKISEENLYIAERGKEKALSSLIPKLSAFSNYTKFSEDKFSETVQIIQPDSSLSWGLRLDQSLSLGGREITAFRISRENTEKVRFDLNAVIEDYLLRVSSAYYDVLRAKKSAEIAKANVERLTKHRDAAAIRVKVGEVTKTALLRAEAELSGARSDLVRAENNLNLVRAVLARVVGINGEYELKEGPQFPVSSQQSSDLNFSNIDCRLATADCLKQIALSERVELKGLEIQKRIAEHQVEFAKGSYWPTLSIEGVYSRRDDNPAITFVNKESIFGGLKLTFPFFEGGLRRAEVKEAEALQRQTELFYEDLKKTIRIEVETAYLDFMTQKGVLKSLEDQLTFAGDNYNAVSKQFEFGLANSIDVMDANTLLVTAERQLADARYNYQLSMLRLKRATGVLLKIVVRKDPVVIGQNR